MDFKKFTETASKMASHVEKYARDKQTELMRTAMRQLHEKSDEEIRKIYQVRYENPKWNDEFISAIEREARRRGID